MNFVKFIMTFFTIFFIALTLSVDDFSVGVAYGLFKTRLSIKQLLITILGSATSTYGIMLIAKFVFTKMPDVVTDWISAIILGGLGCKMIYDGWKEKDNYSEIAKKTPIASDSSKPVNFWQVYLVGLGLGVDDFAQALGLSIAGFPIVLTVLLLEAAELIMILTGNYLALKGFSKKIRGKLNIIPGIVLILIGLYNLFF